MLQFNELLEVLGLSHSDASKRITLYSIEELSNLTFLERVKLTDWTLEIFTIIFIVVYIVFFKLGDYYNTSLVRSYLKGLEPVFTSNFYQFGTSATDRYIKDSSEAFSSYATGRDNVAKVDITFKLKPRHNTFVWAMEYLLSFFTESVVAPEDKAEIVITPSASYDNFIAAITSKFGMNKFRKFSYYLSLTRTSDLDNLPPTFVYMSEVNELQDKITTPQLKQALTVDAANFLNYIAFTDQSSEKPESLRDLIPSRRIVISTSVTNSAASLKQLGQIIDAILDIVDKLASQELKFKSETLKKVVKAREAEVTKIQKLIEEAKREKLLDEKAEQKRAEMKKLRAKSPQEQARLEKKAAEKKQRKLQKKHKVRM